MHLKHLFWRCANFYGWLLGHARLAPLHRVFLNLSLHGLGYDNARHTGEEWFVKRILAKENPEVAIDVGANIGAYSNMLAVQTSATIYAIEPAAASFAELQKTATLYPSRIHAQHVGLSDHNGNGILHSREALSEKATLSEISGKGSALQEEVPLKTLDTFVQEQGITVVDFIKIDTEGHELAVFKGMQQTLHSLRPKYIQFEFNHTHLYNDTTLYKLAQLLQGYDLYRLLPRGWVKVDPTNMSANIFMFCNIVAVRKKI